MSNIPVRKGTAVSTVSLDADTLTLGPEQYAAHRPEAWPLLAAPMSPPIYGCACGRTLLMGGPQLTMGGHCHTVGACVPMRDRDFHPAGSPWTRIVLAKAKARQDLNDTARAEAELRETRVPHMYGQVLEIDPDQQAVTLDLTATLDGLSL